MNIWSGGNHVRRAAVKEKEIKNNIFIEIHIGGEIRDLVYNFDF